MTVIPRKIRREHGEYWELVDVRRVNGKVVQKYVGYLGKSLHSKNEIDPEKMMQYVQRLLKKGISQDSINQVLNKIGIEYDAWPITKIIIENDLRLEKVFLKLK
jgi:hypothetical protein